MEKNLHDGHRARIRAAYLERGLNGMPDHEVLELLLTYCIPRRDVNPIAHRLMQTFGSLTEMMRVSAQELMCVEGIGEHAATFLRLLFDVHQRLELQSMQNITKKTRLENPVDACRYALALSHGDTYETLRLISLDTSMTVLHTDVLGVGSLTKVGFEPRRVIETALLHKARFVILTHNHPSGILVPSAEDHETAKMIQEVASKLEIDVRDQLILSKNAAYSFQYDRVFLFSTPSVSHAMTLEEYCNTICAPRTQSQSS